MKKILIALLIINLTGLQENFSKQDNKRPKKERYFWHTRYKNKDGTLTPALISYVRIKSAYFKEGYESRTNNILVYAFFSDGKFVYRKGNDKYYKKNLAKYELKKLYQVISNIWWELDKLRRKAYDIGDQHGPRALYSLIDGEKKFYLFGNYNFAEDEGNSSFKSIQIINDLHTKLEQLGIFSGGEPCSLENYIFELD